MLYEEGLMKSLCKEMGITWVDEQGYPKLNEIPFSSLNEDDILDCLGHRCISKKSVDG
ncbi:hypothetical protein [Anaerotruncus colihominis]|uniref:Uncharacterized protein n=1 Tax=Anaerotruncus colihominis DSM 17241 TaxID=445972 RepID=B0PE36_9FIRM|nr:hypothetical protein [Anaerotruncus colihominis]EDS10225.1 hypothetical protein ANACOL_02821 [Anaerotruncus colihominis DSM 17241]UWN76398.1 hypothetical protein NQ528_07535 [Anaerotruncus colihominis]